MTDQSNDDAKLLAALLEGDDRAMEALAQRHERSMLGLARGLLGGNDALARDAVQETWMRVLRYGRGFSGRCSVRTWLLRILMNRSRDLVTRRSQPSAEGMQTIAAPTAARDDESIDLLRRAVERLPRLQREIVILCYHENITHALAAEILDVPLGTVKSRLHAALQSLRETLAREEVAV